MEASHLGLPHQCLEDQAVAYIAAVLKFSETAAIATAEFLRRVAQRSGLPIGSAGLHSLSPAQLLGIGLALQLNHWEICGFIQRSETKLPSPRDVIRQVSSASDSEELRQYVFLLTFELLAVVRNSFVFPHHQFNSSLDLAFKSSDEDAVLEALADFLVHQANDDQ